MASLQKQRQDSLTRLLIYALGVSPQEFYLIPNAQGWISIKELLRALTQDKNSPNAREGAIHDACLSAPEDLEISANYIRARRRASLPMEYAVDPPGHLYFGARPKNYSHVLDKGLQAGDNGVLLLLPDPEKALQLARRREPDPILLTIQARKAKERGMVFDLLGEDIYLCQRVEKEFLMGPVPPETPVKKPVPQVKDVLPDMGAFILGEEKPYKQKGLKKEIAWKKQRKREQRG